MRFPHDTFIVLDMPPHIEQHVRAIRRRYESMRQFLPVEVTVAGSSGVGVFDPGQDADEALAALEEIARRLAPFAMEFTKAARFPNSGVFYFEIKDTKPLFAIHNRILAAALRFKPSPFPFSPHLTIDTFDNAPAELAQELLALPAPQGPSTVQTMSVYTLNGWDCRLVKRIPLGEER